MSVACLIASIAAAGSFTSPTVARAAPAFFHTSTASGPVSGNSDAWGNTTTIALSPPASASVRARLFRHADLRELRDITEEDPLEVEASKYSLNYIKLDGNVGCMVNGAGLAMATMDIIKYAGGMPANFLDVGGGASSEQVAHAFEILLSDKNVKAVLINIFGGILRVDTLATGVVEAARKTNIKLPIVLRLEGTNVEEGKKILMNSGFNFVVTDTMKDAADRVVAAARGTAGVTEWR